MRLSNALIVLCLVSLVGCGGNPPIQSVASFRSSIKSPAYKEGITRLVVFADLGEITLKDQTWQAFSAETTNSLHSCGIEVSFRHMGTNPRQLSLEDPKPLDLENLSRSDFRPDAILEMRWVSVINTGQDRDWHGLPGEKIGFELILRDIKSRQLIWTAQMDYILRDYVAENLAAALISRLKADKVIGNDCIVPQVPA